jgi:proteasome lid subunit RPN8/RPN11
MLMLTKKAKKRKLNGSGRSFLQDNLQMELLHTKKNGEIRIDGLVVPPFASSGPYYSGFPTNELPMDLSYIGTAHSHPGSSNRPSLQDLNNFFGFVSIIISYPYEYDTIAAYDRNGNNIRLIIE